MPTANDIKEAVKKNNVRFIYVRDCSICSHPIGFVFFNNEPFFDTSCDCAPGLNTPPKPKQWAHVLDYYNLSEDKKTLNKLFGFTNKGESNDKT